MGQQSLFMTPSQESFPMSQLSAYNRNQPQQQQQQQQQHAQFGQTPPQQNTIMVSSATSSLMSTSIKPPNQNTAYGKFMFLNKKKIEHVYAIYDRKKEIMTNTSKIVKIFIYRNNSEEFGHRIVAVWTTDEQHLSSAFTNVFYTV